MPPARVIIPIALACMSVCLALAFVADCVRLDRVARADAIQADQELLAFEQRYVQSLRGLTALSSQTASTLDAYQLTTSPEDRHQAFLTLCQTVKQEAGPQLATGLSDRLQGIENRWSIAYPTYEVELKRQQDFRQTLRGRVAAWIWGG